MMINPEDRYPEISLPVLRTLLTKKDIEFFGDKIEKHFAVIIAAKRKTVPLTREEHIQLAKDMRDAQKLLERWFFRLCRSWGKNCGEAKMLQNVLKILSSEMCNVLDERYYSVRIENDEHIHSPYYGQGKLCW